MASRRRKPRSKKPSSKKSHSDSSSLPDKQEAATAAELVEEQLDSEKTEPAKEITTLSRVETTFAGPLPTPQDFREYSEVMLDAPDRIMRMAEREQQIRAEGQKGMLANERQKINLSALIGIVLLGVAGIATWRGQESIAIPLGLAGTFALIIRLLDKWISHLFGKDE